LAFVTWHSLAAETALATVTSDREHVIFIGVYNLKFTGTQLTWKSDFTQKISGSIFDIINFNYRSVAAHTWAEAHTWLFQLKEWITIFVGTS